MALTEPHVAVVAVIDGVLAAPGAAVVPVTDRGFQLGDAVFATMGAFGGRALDEAWHLEKLRAGAAALGIGEPEGLDEAAVRADVAAALAAGGWAEAVVRVQITRGDGFGPRPSPGQRARRVVVARPRPAPPASLSLVTVAVRRPGPASVDPSIKAGSYLACVLAARAAQLAGADDGVMLDERGDLAEASAANVFVVPPGAAPRLITPPPGAILPGVTRRRLIALAAADGWLVEERAVSRAELAAAAEVFLTSSGRGVVPAHALDGRALPGAAGPAVRRAQALWAAFVAAFATASPPAR